MGADTTQAELFTVTTPLTAVVVDEMVGIIAVEFNFETVNPDAPIALLCILTSFDDSASG